MQNGALNTEDYIEQGGIGRHETFTPRYGWLTKGYRAVVEDPNVFRAPNSIERLGVGKNMVNSIRFWCQAFKLIETDKNASISATELGQRLLGENGWDPFLEDVASLWLLHWQLFVPRLEAVSWPLAFNKCNLWNFDLKQLTKVIIHATQKYPRLAALSENSIERDASCIIRMYTEDSKEKESEIECPFSQLGILHRSEKGNSVCFDTSDKQNLPPLIFASACFSYIVSYIPSGQRTISLQHLTYAFNSPGVVFKISETAVGSQLNEAAQSLKDLSLVDVMGNMQLHFNKDPEELYWVALEKYYRER